MSDENKTKRSSLFEMEEEILRFWQEDTTFEKSLAKNPADRAFSFYDGPPFITGLPHYATLLPSIAKDVIPRYQTMKGKSVRRVWGWDCHGLPAENQVEKQLGLKNRRDIETLGVDKFVEACRSYVKEGSEQWRWYVDHIGRWVDMDNAYRTDQLSYMETVIQLFKQLYEKDLIYRGRRVSLYCPRCATPLSKFEETMDDDTYRDVEDPAVTVAFRLLDDDVYLLAWTTTPWTLPANLALAVDPKAEYVRVSDGFREYIMAHQTLEHYRDIDLEIMKTFKGQELIGQRYEPLYSFFKTNPETDYKVYPADFVTLEDGTGIVHIAPGFGEDDTVLGEKLGLSTLLTLDVDCKLVPEVKPWAGQFYKDTDESVMGDLAKRGLLFKRDVITHSYPHCYRCSTPLIYKSQEAWYLSIEPLRQHLLATNKKITWIPKHFGSGRFAYNVENAPDWCLSRTRYWGTPIPVWQTDDGEIFVAGSLQEIAKLSGQKVTDLHRPGIDEVILTLPSGKKAHRVKEVLDCWFESGAMPYAQFHYPFENVEEFEKSFPTDFIVEYTGQLRGWFYYLHVLGNALKNSPAFKNVAVTGVLMGTDGRKMSKSYGNYPDPRLTIEKYGAESLRLYFMGSKIMNGEDLSISEDEIREQSRLLNILHNSVSYYQTYAKVHNFKAGNSVKPTLLDRWIVARLEETVAEIDEGLKSLDFVRATKAIRPMVEDLSTWFIRRSRERIVGGDAAALETLHSVLKRLSLAIAPILPFSAEKIWRDLDGVDSVHLQDFPEPHQKILDETKDLREEMARVRTLVSSVHMERATHQPSLPLRQPLAKLTIAEKSAGNLSKWPELLDILRDEINVKDVEIGKKDELDTKLTPELLEEGKLREITRAIQEARKKSGLNVGENARLEYFATDEHAELFKKFSDQIKKSAGIVELHQHDSEESLAEIAPGLFVKITRG
ncbi:MAG TPA: isoleucine--tRNA ligase [Candidatus Saccharimonadales bacterium]|nr:isoleucine--tRNA ligase [Candidatus Saccharimonadales bacterium]